MGVEGRPEMHKAGMVCFLLSEAAFFSTLIMAYVIFLRHGGSPPTPRDALELPQVIANTLCLLASSFTIHRAEKSLRTERRGGFRAWWALTVLLGVAFLAGTGIEWQGLIRDHGLTMGRNMFGTTYYTLVGFHAFHVTLGVIALGVVWGLSVSGQLQADQTRCRSRWSDGTGTSWTWCG